MDLAIVAGIGMIGTYMINKNNTDNNPITESEKKYSRNYNQYKKYVDQIESNENKEFSYENSYVDSNTVKLFPTEFNSKTKHIYDMQSINQLDNKINQMANIQTQKSLNPVLTNIISPFVQPFESITKEILTMGTVPINELNNPTIEGSYLDAFKLQTVNNIKEPFSVGDQLKPSNPTDFSPFDNKTFDMTYQIVNKEDFTQNNMQPFNSKRDVETNESNNFEYKMDIFAGSSKNWVPKKEAPHFFEPQQNIQTPMGNSLVAEEERNRITQSRARQNERPFEPVKIARGVNLGYNEQPKSGFHDPFRIMPHDTNDLRPANKPKITFEDRIKGVPRKGEKRSVSAPVIKRRPDHWRHQTIDDLVPSKAIITKQSNQGLFIIPDNARRISSEVFGSSVGTSRVGGADREGKVKISKRVKHVNDMLGPSSTQIYNKNEKSYNILLNERNSTNYDIRQAPTNKNQQGITFDPNDIAKQTARQELTTAQFNNNTKQLINSYANLTDSAKHTIKQILSTQTYDQIISSNQHNAYSNLPDTAKQTLKQILTMSEFNNNLNSTQKNISSQITDRPTTTMKEILAILESNTNIQSAHHQPTTSFTDIAQTTNKQTLTNLQFNTNLQSAQQNLITNLTDIAQTTNKQTLTNLQFNNNIQSAQHNLITNLTDIAQTTNKQTLTNQQYNTNIQSAQHNQSSQYTDKSRQTLKELLTALELNTNIQPAHHNTISYLSDDAKTTLKQIISNIQLDTNMNPTNKESKSNIMDLAKNTIKQLLTKIELNTNLQSGNKQITTTFMDDAKNTTRQTLTTKEFNTFIGKTMSDYSNLSDEAKTTIKQLISTQPLNTIIGSTQHNAAVNLTDEAKQTVKQLLTLETFSSYIKQNPGSYGNITDEAKQTVKQLLSLIETNTNIKSGNQSTYADLSDIAKTTIKEYISTVRLNNNVGNIRKEIAHDPNDITRPTHKQDLLNEKYMGTITNSKIGMTQTKYDILPTMKDITKIINYKSAAKPAGISSYPKSQADARNMRQNISKEVISKGVSPTLSGPKVIPTKEIYKNTYIKQRANYDRSNAPSLTTKINLTDRQMFNLPHHNQKTFPSYDERLYNELLNQFNKNPFINNPQSITNSKFVN